MKFLKSERSIKEKLQDRYILEISNESTFAKVWSMVLSRLNLIILIGVGSVVLIFIGILLVSFTPLREYIPGYPDGDVRWVYTQNAIKVDSLEQQIRIRDQYVQNVKNILKGKETFSYMNESDTIPLVAPVSFDQNDFDSILQMQAEEEERYNLSSDKGHSKNQLEINKQHFFTPLKGAVTNLFDAQGSHYGIDIASNLNEPILSVLDGTVILAGWTLEAGYIIQVQHQNNLVSVYKHNSQLLKEMGSHVSAGEAIAIIGNTGEFTTGPHLHFELWHNGKPINPNDYIVF